MNRETQALYLAFPGFMLARKLISVDAILSDRLIGSISSTYPGTAVKPKVYDALLSPLLQLVAYAKQ